MELSAVNLHIDRKHLLRNVSLTLRPGEVLAVLGPNGAGKSSLLKVMGGEYDFYQGTVSLNHQDYQHWKPQQVASMIGVLPQQSQLMFPFSVREVVMLGRIPHNTGRVRDAQIVSLALQRVDAEHLAESLYPVLSGGEKQRVQLARVLAQIWEETALGRRYLLLDEPTSALDISHQHHTLKLARSLAKEGVGVLAVLHDLNLAAQYADRILVMHNGVVIIDGEANKVLTPQIIRYVFNIEVEIVPHPLLNVPLVING